MVALDRLMLFIYGMVILCVGILVHLVHWDFWSYDEAIAYLHSTMLYENVYGFIFIGVLAVLMGSSLINIALSRHDHRKALDYKTERGHVRVLLSAVEEYVRKIALTLDSVKDIKCQVRIRGKGLFIRAKVVLSSEMNISNVAGDIQKHMANHVLKMLGVELPITINISVAKIVLKDKDDKKDKGSKSKEKYEDVFKGIEY